MRWISAVGAAAFATLCVVFGAATGCDDPGPPAIPSSPVSVPMSEPVAEPDGQVGGDTLPTVADRTVVATTVTDDEDGEVGPVAPTVVPGPPVPTSEHGPDLHPATRRCSLLGLGPDPDAGTHRCPPSWPSWERSPRRPC